MENEISDIFKIQIIHNNNPGTQYFFDFLPVFKFEKKRGEGETFKDTFYSYLLQNETEVFTTKKNLVTGIRKTSVTLSMIKVNLNFLGKI